MQKDFLESLVGLLSSSEKRYIKKRITLHGKGNNFSGLFNSIASGQKKSTVVQGIKNLNTYYATKSQLTEKLFELLRMYHSNTSREQAMKSICMDVEILYSKGAYTQCRKLIDGALTVCKKAEWFELEMYLLVWKESLLIALFNMDSLPKEMDANLARQREVISKLTELHHHKQFMYAVFLIVKKSGFSRNSTEFAGINKLIQNYKRGGVQKPDSHRARICYYIAYTYYYYALQEHTQCYRYAQKHVKETESFQKEAGMPMPKYLITALTNVITCEVSLKKYDKLQQSLHKIRAIKFEVKKEEANIFAHTGIIETDMYIQTGQFDKIQDIHTSVQEGLHLYDSSITKEQKITLYYNMAYLSIGGQKYSLALQWINKILNDSGINIREDLYCIARILNLIIHYELGNAQLLEHLALSTYRYLYKRQRVFKVENAIMKFIREQLRCYPSSKQITNALQQLLSTVKKLCAANKAEQTALEYFDIISWLESKIQKRSFAEIVQEKASASVRYTLP